MGELYSHQNAVIVSRQAKSDQLIGRLFLPEHLPIAAKHDEIADAIKKHQVTIVTGETGSGKTTQLPKICLEIGRGVHKLIGHTQPRRISAKVVAQRLAEELGVSLGEEVGYQVRFDSKLNETTLIKVMTDGIVLSEIRNDRLLDSYDTIIIDEAHERSLNIDFILGYLLKILPSRPDLKVIITSATIDSERFAKHFNAPVINVSGRNYDVDIVYRPFLKESGRSDDARDEEESYDLVPGYYANFKEDDVDLAAAVVLAVKNLLSFPRGDILVFLPGERDIKDIAATINSADMGDVEVLPLYARLSTAEQHKVFAPHQQRRVILATNIAEASLTIPDIKYVVDSGLARISRFNYRTKVQRLPIEPISKASADQRAGRCGRTSNGICIRLYSKEDYSARAQYTEPEIARTNLASVLLQMAASGLGDIKDFPFLDPPDERAVKEGLNLLLEIGALERHGEKTVITDTGRSMLDFPLDPRLARAIVQAVELNCLYPVIVAVSFLSIQDPREFPTDKAEDAKYLHSRFAHPKSDFMTVIKLWEYLSQLQAELGSNQFRKRCKSEFLNILRIREWQDIVSQIVQVFRAKRIRVDRKQSAEYDTVHRAILSGFISHVGTYDPKRNIYKGVKNSSFYLTKSSVVAARKPKWILAANLVETSRVFAYMAGEINPSWLLGIAKSQLRYSYGRHWWDPMRAEAMSGETVSLYGLALFKERAVGLRKVNQSLARREFIENALCLQNWECEIVDVHEMWDILDRHNSQGVSLSGNGLFTIEELTDFYDYILPADIASGTQFEVWHRKNKLADSQYLQINLENFIKKYYQDLESSGFPKYLTVKGFQLPVIYPGEFLNTSDHIIVEVERKYLLGLDDAAFSYSVPGYRTEIITRMIKSLPKDIRRSLVPLEKTASYIDDLVKLFLAEHTGEVSVSLEDIVKVYLSAEYHIDRADLDMSNVFIPKRLKFIFNVYEGDQLLATGDSISVLQRELMTDLRRDLTKEISGSISTAETSTWVWDNIPQSIFTDYGTTYPTLSPQENSVKIVAVESYTLQQKITAYGIRKLIDLEIVLGDQIKNQLLTGNAKRTLAKFGYGNDEFLTEVKRSLIDYAAANHKGTISKREDYASLLKETVDLIIKSYKVFFRDAITILDTGISIKSSLGSLSVIKNPKLSPCITDVKETLDGLLHKGFILCTGYQDIAKLIRYLDAIRKRIELLSIDPFRDFSRMTEMNEVIEEYLKTARRVSGGTFSNWPLCRSGKGRDGDLLGKRQGMGMDVSHHLGLGIANVENTEFQQGSGDSVNRFTSAVSGPELIHTFGRETQVAPFEDLWKIRFMIEELRVSLWAQELGTSQKISRERINRELARISGV